MQLETAAAAVPLKLTRSRQHGGSADDIGQVTFAWMRQPIPAWALFPRTAQLLAALGVPASGLPVSRGTVVACFEHPVAAGVLRHRQGSGT